MALTSGGFFDGKGSPDKHVVSQQGTGGPQFTGVYGDTNASGEVPDQSGGDGSAKAKAIFGSPSAPAAPRVAGVAAEAYSASGGDGGDYNIGSAFIDGNTPTTAQYTKKG